VKARVATLPTRALIAIAAAAVLVYALAVWFLVVSPKRAEAGALNEDVIAAELNLAATHVTAKRPQTAGTHVVRVLELAKAMPSSNDQSGLVLELDALGSSSGLTLTSISPGDAVLGAGGATMIPVVVTAQGSYRQVTRFLKHTRDLVRVRRGAVHATGRLLTIQAVELAESNAKGFPLLDATIALNAFVYDGPIIQVTPPTTTTDDQSTSTSAARSAP
jgi:Tfp pilus assembly protein PilO